jgi:hypothetical protein
MCLTEEELAYDSERIKDCERVWRNILWSHNDSYDTAENRSKACTCAYHRLEA